MVERGLYELNYGGLTWCELWRFSERKPLVFFFALGFKLSGKRGARIWLPARENERPCAEVELSERARATLLPIVNEARALGYANGRFSTLARRDDPASKEAFSYAALHEDGVRTLFLCCAIRQEIGQPPVEKMAVAGAVTLVEPVVNMVAHYFFDRAWERHFAHAPVPGAAAPQP